MNQEKGSFTHPGSIALLLIFSLMALMFVGLGCDQTQDVKKISLQKSERIQTLPSPAEREEVLKIAVSAMVSPKETFDFYKEILAYISQKASPIAL